MKEELGISTSGLDYSLKRLEIKLVSAEIDSGGIYGCAEQAVLMNIARRAFRLWRPRLSYCLVRTY